MTAARPDWLLADGPLPADLDALAARLQVSPRIAAILWRRGLTDPAAMEVFLSPGLRHLPQPRDFPGLTAAAEALARGIAAGLPMAVWGDYDVDGVTATALVREFLAGRGVTVDHHIPERSAGYGLNVAGIEALADRGVRLLLTVDCGITAMDPLARARELGMTVVVSDHHLPGDALPVAEAICNPRLGPCPCPHLAGVGVAFLLMAALNRLLPGEPADMRPLLDLVALGTLADMVELTGANRILVKNGLLLLAEAQRPGIRALKEAAGFEAGGELGAGRVVFGLAPRINAAGRLGNADAALGLLLARDMAEARPLAARLDGLNTERKAEEDRIVLEAQAQARQYLDRFGLVLHGHDWHPGVIGIVASRVVETFNRPALVLCTDGQRLKGSGRGIPGFDLYAALAQCGPLLLGFGGHRQAAGLSLDPARLEELRQAFHLAVRQQLGGRIPPPRLRLDDSLPLGDVDARLLKELALLQPFGLGNPEPLFRSGPLVVQRRRNFGNGHVNLAVHDPHGPRGPLTMNAKVWRQADVVPQDIVGRRLDLAFSPKLSTFGGVMGLELHVKDWRLVQDG